MQYSPRQDDKYHGLCYTGRGALVGTRNKLALNANVKRFDFDLIAQWVHHNEGSIRRPIAPRANALTPELHLAPLAGRARRVRERERERMFYLTTHSTHFIYGYMASDIWLRTILIVRKETRCRHIGCSYRLTARVLLYTQIPQTG